jgi:pimeloyl-ACP methyl ester carboxylesterase
MLNVAVVPAISRSPEPDPLFVLVGGPGQSATETFPAMFSTLFRIHEERDIVLVDQRGTGESNPLRCLDPEEETPVEDEQVVALLQSCPEQLEADLHLYTTDIAMQDLEAVRAALGYETINLYGVSYGTRAALVYLKMFPERVRSMILDAVVDPSFVLFEDAARDGQRALELFFERCEGDTECSVAFPDLGAEFESLISKLNATSQDVTLAHPVTGKPLEMTITQTTIANIVFNSLYTPDLVAMLPLAIHQASVEENYAPLITLAYLSDAGIYDGMFYAVACAEDAPLLSAQEAEPQSEEGIFGSNLQLFLEVCESWPKGHPSPVLREPVDSDVPVLLFSGEADPITPPSHAEELTASLSNSLHLVFGDMGHGNSSSQCGAKIVDRFIESASVDTLEVACVEIVEPPPFFVDFSGPQP